MPDVAPVAADEHYVPTLLAYLGKDQETDCWGFLVNVDWSRGGAHPRTYAVEDIDVERCAPELAHAVVSLFAEELILHDELFDDARRLSFLFLAVKESEPDSRRVRSLETI